MSSPHLLLFNDTAILNFAKFPTDLPVYPVPLDELLDYLPSSSKHFDIYLGLQKAANSDKDTLFWFLDNLGKFSHLESVIITAYEAALSYGDDVRFVSKLKAALTSVEGSVRITKSGPLTILVFEGTVQAKWT